MKDPDFGFTNLYLKTGVILVSVAALVYLTGLVRDPSLPSTALREDLVRICIVAGVVSLVIGWIVKARGGRDARPALLIQPSSTAGPSVLGCPGAPEPLDHAKRTAGPLPTGDSRIVMSTSSELRNRVGTYIRSHPREVRLLAFLAVLCMVWMLAPSIESLIHGFLDGLQEPGSR